MSVTWEDATEVNAGLIVEGRVSPRAYRPELFLPPYDKLVRLVQDGITEIEELMLRVGLDPVQTALSAVHNMNGAGEADWLSILERTSNFYDIGIRMERSGLKLQRGEDIDWSTISYYAQNAQQNVNGGFTRLSDIKETEISYVPTGWSAFDEHLCGLPEVGLVLLGGMTGSGKTWFWIKLSAEYARANPDKIVAFFSLEMILPEIKARYDTLNLPLEVQERILINPHPIDVDGVFSKTATLDNVGLIGVDFVDLLVQGEVNASSMAQIYKTGMLGAKNAHCPVVFLGQLSGTYTGGLPKPGNLYYTKMAQALGWMILMTYNPMTDWFGEEAARNAGLPVKQSRAYLLAWKMRGGFRNHLQDNPGAIQMTFLQNRGWGGDKGKHRWYSLQKEG